MSTQDSPAVHVTPSAAVRAYGNGAVGRVCEILADASIPFSVSERYGPELSGQWIIEVPTHEAAQRVVDACRNTTCRVEDASPPQHRVRID